MLKIYSDNEWVPSSLPIAIILYPFWAPPFEDQQDLEFGRYSRYLEIGSSLFEVTSLEDCDAVVCPLDWSSILKDPALVEAAGQFVAQASNHKKSVLIFFGDDSTEKIPLENTVVFRTSVSGASTRAANEFAQPSWYEDPIAKYHGGVLPIRPKTLRPTVGFCGLCTKPCVSREVRTLLKRLLTGRRGPTSGHDLRWKAIRRLQASNELRTDFILRDQFYGGAVSISKGEWNLELKKRVRSEYLTNLIDTDYTLCVRGTGNYCHRLYETLCCGRIPVFLNTDCVLPYDFVVKWKDYFVWVEEEELPSIADKVIAFHERLSDAAFRECQRVCRELWQEWLSPEGFFKNLPLHLGRI